MARNSVKLISAVAVGLLLLAWMACRSGVSGGAGTARVHPELTMASVIARVQDHYRAAGVPSPAGGELRRAFRPGGLNLPTMMTRIGDNWFVVDSYNNRVLYSDEATASLTDWRLLDGDLSRPHSIAGNREYLVVDDTEAHSVRVYRRQGEGYRLHQVFIDAGARPHRVWYDEDSDRFFVLAANSQELTVYRIGDAGLEQVSRASIEAIAGVYTRSFRMIDGAIWLFPSNGVVTVIDPDMPGYPSMARYRVPGHLSGLNDMIRVGETWYLSATRNLLAACVPSTDGGPEDRFDCKDLRQRVDYRGNPYLFDFRDDALTLGIVAGRDSILRLALDGKGGIASSSVLLP